MMKTAVKWMVLSVLVIGLTGCSEYGRMRETPGEKPHEEPLLIMRDGIVPFEGGEALYRNVPETELESPLDMNDAAVVAAGAKEYVNYCIHCHGKNYDGYGTVGQSFAPKPDDLREADVQEMSDGELFQYIGYSKPKSRHPALATTVSIIDRWRITAYIKSLGIRP
ncbi:MAG: c-type cytochrome [Thermodesulfobacteriota bacterium]